MRNVGPQPESPPEALPARFSGSGRSYLSYQLAWWPLTVHGHLWVGSQAPRSRAERGEGSTCYRRRGWPSCMRVTGLTRIPAGPASLNMHPHPCLPSLIGFHDTVDDELARPRRAADEAAQLERACRCSRRSRTFTLDEGGEKGVVCRCVTAVDVLRQLSMAMRQAGLVATTAWWCGQAHAVRA